MEFLTTVAQIEIDTPFEHFVLIKPGCWAPLFEWSKWAVNKRVCVHINWITVNRKARNCDS
jgi:hypothetical protein